MQIARLWQMKKAIVIPIVVGTLGSITTMFEKYIENIQSLGIEIRIQHIQKSALLGTARIIRKALPCYIPRKRYCCETFNISHSKNQRYWNLWEIILNIIIKIIIIPKTRKYWVDVQQGIVSSHWERDPLWPWLAILQEIESQ